MSSILPKSSLLSLGILCVSSMPALASLSDGEASLLSWAVHVPGGVEIHARVHGADGDRFALLWKTADDRRPRILAMGMLDSEGDGAVDLVVPNDLPDDFKIQLTALWRGPQGPAWAGSDLPLTGGSDCQLLDFDYTLGPDEPVRGQILDDEWALLGMTISAENHTGGNPDLAIVFDSSDISGEDTDLATPGYGPGNDTALGKLLIVPEDDVDADQDGLIDDPDDDAGGGTIAFDFDSPAMFCSITLIDMDDPIASELRFIDSNDNVVTIGIENKGDNSVQKICFQQEDVMRFEVSFGGSGGIADIEIAPCPRLVNLDETPFGIPLGFKAGLQITDQFASLGLTVSAINANPSHPDKAILFDSENPTGGDFDLQTPGPGIGNDTPLGMVLIIAEDDVDSDNDGLVDDPDDEEAGGRMNFFFDSDVTFFSATVLDVDGSEVDVLALFDANDVLLEVIEVQALGDNSVQLLQADAPVANVRRMELDLGGSGAVTRIRWCPGTVDANP